jgi:hypothetical protein
MKLVSYQEMALIGKLLSKISLAGIAWEAVITSASGSLGLAAGF